MQILAAEGKDKSNTDELAHELFDKDPVIALEAAALPLPNDDRSADMFLPLE